MTSLLQHYVSAPSKEREREIAALGPWFHNLHLPDGRQTAPDHPLGDFPRFKWRQVARSIPRDLSGWTALDIGCNAGFYSFELAKRGATVLGIDLDEHYLDQARWARGLYGFGGRVRFERKTVYDLARTRRRFDLILFLGVLYHLRHPLLALDIVTEKVDRLLVLQTLTMPGDAVIEPPRDVPIDRRSILARPGWPKMAFLEPELLHGPSSLREVKRLDVDAENRGAAFSELEAVEPRVATHV